MNLLFGYKVLKDGLCGFPDNSLSKVLNTLEDAKISYQIIEVDKNPIIKDFVKLNNYPKYLDLALKNLDKSKRLDYLKICKNKIIDFIHFYNLEINEKKTYIVNLKNGFNFLGYNFRIINNKTIINLSENARNNIKKGIKKGIYRYQNNMITFEKYFYSLENYFHSYNFVNKDKIKHIIERYY